MKVCQYPYLLSTDECERLKSSIQSIADKIESPSIHLCSDEQKEDLKHDLTQAREIFSGSLTLSAQRTKSEQNKMC